MGIAPTFTREEVRKRVNAFLDKIEEKQIQRAKELGEICLTHARNIPAVVGYTDQTGNLRSSTGYAVFLEGTEIFSSYPIVAGGEEGARKGLALATQVGEKTGGVCLVVTAGMNYATYLEAKGRDVLTSAQQLAERELPKMLEKLADNIKLAAQ